MTEENTQNQVKDYLRIAVDEGIRDWEKIKEIDYMPRISAADILGLLYLIKAIQMRLDSEPLPPL